MNGNVQVQEQIFEELLGEVWLFLSIFTHSYSLDLFLQQTVSLERNPQGL